MFFPSLASFINFFLKLFFPQICYMDTPARGSSSPSNSALTQLVLDTPLSAVVISQLILETPLDSSSSSTTATTLHQSASLRGRILDSSLRIFRAQSPRPVLDFFQFQTACIAKFLATLSSAVSDDTMDFYVLEYPFLCLPLI